MDEHFGDCLRRLRRAAGLTQATLAERSGLSVEGVSALERGERQRPRKSTLDLLTTGLGLSGEGAAALRAAASRRRPRMGSWGPIPRQLPPCTDTFSGRESELDFLLRLLGSPEDSDAPTIAAVVGMGGVGKTALAIQAASRLSQHYPDGQLYLDLRGHDGRAPLTAQRALALLIASLGGDARQVPDDVDTATATFRSLVSGSRVLIVLDNAADQSQVEPLLPATSGCAVLVTSRRTITLRNRVHYLALGALTDSDSHRLLAALVGDARLAAEPTAAVDLVRTCGGLPLALRIVAARLCTRPSWPLASLASRLSRSGSEMGELVMGAVSVRASIDSSIAQLENSTDRVDRMAALVYTHVGLLPSPSLSLASVAALVALSDADALLALERLVDASLLSTSVFGRYRMHDLVQAEARDRAAHQLDEGDRRQAIERIMRFYVAVAWRTRDQTRPSLQGCNSTALIAFSGSLTEVTECLDLLAADAEQIRALAAMLVSSGHPGVVHVLWLTLGLVTYFVARADSAGWPEMLRLALSSSYLEGRVVEGHLREDLALALTGCGQQVAALNEARKAVALFRAASDERATAAGLGTVALVLERLDRLPESIAVREQSRALIMRSGDERALAAAHRDLGLLYAHVGECEKGLAHERRSLEIYSRIGHVRGMAMAAVNLGAMLRDAGELATARCYIEQSAALFRQVGDRPGETEALDELGLWHVMAGEPEQGLIALSEGLALVDANDSGQREASLRTRLGIALAQLGRLTEAERSWSAAGRIYRRRGESQSLMETQNLIRAAAVQAAT